MKSTLYTFLFGSQEKKCLLRAKEVDFPLLCKSIKTNYTNLLLTFLMSSVTTSKTHN